MLGNYEIIEKSANEYIKHYIKHKNDYSFYAFGNNVLYNLCKENPYHNKADIIYAKIWIIGRSYAAAIERRKNKDKKSNDKFYKDVVNKLMKIGKKIDTQIAELSKYECINEENIEKALYLHAFLTNEFRDMTGLEKKSLASKYLHFHCPKIFFIYDSIAGREITKIVRKNRKKSSVNKNFDNVYADFCYRALALMNYIKEHYPSETNITPRDIDNILYVQKLA